MKETTLTTALNRRPELKHLQAFVGSWRTEGKMKGETDASDVIISGTDTYEWVSGGCFLLHRVDVLIGNERNETTELIGYDPATETYVMHYFDSQGNTGSMQARVQNGVWSFRGTSLRFTGSFSADGKKLSGKWQQTPDGEQWQHLMDIQLTKI